MESLSDKKPNGKTERQLIESARDRLCKAESLIALAVKDINGLVTHNAKAGNAARSNAAFIAQAKIEAAGAGLKLAHGESTELLLSNWPDFGADVVVRGGGGR